MNSKPDGKVVIMHGFEKEEVFRIMKAIKETVENPKEIAFSMSTPTNLEWKLADIISDVREDHEYFMEMERKKKENNN